jgi:hypothetical protein
VDYKRSDLKVFLDAAKINLLEMPRSACRSERSYIDK